MKRLLAIIVLAAMPVSLAAQPPLVARRVTEALERGLGLSGGEHVEPGSIRILDSSRLSERVPAFRLVHLQRVSEGEFMATLRCPTAGECLPFLVAFRCRQCLSSLPERSPRHSLPNRALAVHAGEPARLEVAFSGGTLWFPVICLQEGAVGEVVRSRMAGNHRTWAAVVVGARQLRGVESLQ